MRFPREEILPQDCGNISFSLLACSIDFKLKTTTSTTWVSNLPAFPTDSKLANSLNHMNQFLKILSSIYHQTISYCFCFFLENPYTGGHCYFPILKTKKWEFENTFLGKQVVSRSWNSTQKWTPEPLEEKNKTSYYLWQRKTLLAKYITGIFYLIFTNF